MRIVKIETGEVNIPLVTPFKTALRTVDCVNDIIVRIVTEDGQEGFGEAPPTAVITGDTKASVKGWTLRIWMASWKSFMDVS